MDIGQVSRPSISAVQPAQNSESVRPGRPVATELPAAKAVTAPAESAAARFEPSGRADQLVQAKRSLVGFIDRNNDIDPESRTLVTQTVDTRSGEVVRQYPDVNALRLRAYMSQARERAAPAPAEGHPRVERVA